MLCARRCVSLGHDGGCVEAHGRSSLDGNELHLYRHVPWHFVTIWERDIPADWDEQRRAFGFL
jgi:hypothetical protein